MENPNLLSTQLRTFQENLAPGYEFSLIYRIRNGNEKGSVAKCNYIVQEVYSFHCICKREDTGLNESLTIQEIMLRRKM